MQFWKRRGAEGQGNQVCRLASANRDNAPAQRADSLCHLGSTVEQRGDAPVLMVKKILRSRNPESDGLGTHHADGGPTSVKSES